MVCFATFCYIHDVFVCYVVVYIFNDTQSILDGRLALLRQCSPKASSNEKAVKCLSSYKDAPFSDYLNIEDH